MITNQTDNKLNDEAQSELELFKAYREKHNPEVRDQIFVKFMHLVNPVARKYRECGESGEDLLQVGYIGLLKAMERFSPSREVRFSTYATHCISGEIRHYIRDKVEIIRRPRWILQLSQRLGRFMEKFLQEKERLPSPGEISQALNIAPEGVLEIMRVREVASLDGEEFNPNQVALKAKSISYESLSLPLEDRIVLMQARDKLKILQKNIIYLFFDLDLTKTEIAKTLHISQKKVARNLKSGLLKLKELLGKELWLLLWLFFLSFYLV